MGRIEGLLLADQQKARPAQSLSALQRNGAPSGEWIAQQLREALPLPCPYHYVLSHTRPNHVNLGPCLASAAFIIGPLGRQLRDRSRPRWDDRHGRMNAVTSSYRSQSISVRCNRTGAEGTDHLCGADSTLMTDNSGWNGHCRFGASKCRKEKCLPLLTEWRGASLGYRGHE